MTKRTAVIFGGTGFIGSHFAKYLLKERLYDHIYLADIRPVRPDFNFDGDPVTPLLVDVRTPITHPGLPSQVDLIANFAAVHREPGHELHEYYETNVPGAENVCAWAEKVGCRDLIFTSSIAPYGPTEVAKTEESVPTPDSPYGGSKLAAEKIHLGWQRTGTGRRLVIVRPGVVFGPGEGGNVTRLVQATLRGYFVFTGNHRTRKAGGYVKELVRSMIWAINLVPAEGGSLLYNFTMDQAPTIEDYVKTASKVAGKKYFVPSVPFTLLLLTSYAIDGVAKSLGIRQPINPVRIRKTVRSTNIEPGILRRHGYGYRYNLESAMRDWHRERPDEWR